MNEKVQAEFEVQYTSSGADREAQVLRRFQDELDRSARTGDVSAKTQERLSKAIYNSGRAAHAGTVDYSGLNKAIAEMGLTTRQAESDNRTLTNSLSGLRYQLYDVAQVSGTVNLALGAAGVGAGVLSAQYESAFTAVERTSGVTGQAVEQLRSQFLDLSREIPQSFADIANIGSRGAQLGIAADELRDFTEVVAQFVATSDSVTLDQSVEAFGRISNLLGDDDFNRIGSAITKVGVEAAATEAQIVKTTQELAPFGNAVGLSTDEVIALAAAVSSLGQPPERARSAFLSLQEVMNKAISSGSENLQVFAQLLGMTSDEVAQLWKQDPAQFTSSFAQALGNVEDITGALEALGLSEKRATQVFTALANDSRDAAGELSVLDKAFSDSEQGYRDGTELASQYGLIVDDLASRWQIFVNALSEFGAEVGNSFGPALKIVLDYLSQIVHGITDFIRTPFGRGVTILVGVLGALAFAFTGIITTVSLAGAALVGISQAMTGIAGLAGTSSFSVNALATAFRNVIAQAGVVPVLGGARAGIAGVGTAATVAAGQTQAFAGSLGAAGGAAGTGATGLAKFGRGIGGVAKVGGAVGAIALLVNVFTDLRGSVTQFLDMALYLQDSLQGFTNVLNAPIGVLFGLAEAFGFIDTSALSAAQSTVSAGDVIAQVGSVFERISFGIRYAFSIMSAAAQAWVSELAQYAQIATAIFGAVVGRFIGQASQAAQTVSNLFGAFGRDFGKGFTNGLEAFNFSTRTALEGLRDLAQNLPGATGGISDLGSVGGAIAPVFDEGAGSLDGFGDSADDAADSADNLKNSVRTVLDYASDLASVFERAFNIRFGFQIAQDDTTSQVQSIQKAFDDAARSVRDLRTDIRGIQADIQGLNSDIAINEYFLGIAREYGDTQRAAAIEAELAKQRADLASRTQELQDKNRDLTAAQDATSKSLTGNSAQAIKNRSDVLSLTQSYQAQIRALAEQGLSSEELARRTEELRQKFITQLTQMGFNRKEAERYARAFDDVAFAIRNIPRDVTVEIKGLGAAAAALKEFQARVESTVKNARAAVGGGVNIPVTGGGTGYQVEEARKLALALQFTAYTALGVEAARNKQLALAAQYLAQAANARARLLSGSFAEGGYTGAGGKYEPAGVVHRGEYVIPKRDVNQSTGLPYADALGRLMGGARGFATGGPTVGASPAGTQQVALTAGSIQAIAQAVQPYLVVGDKVIAQSAQNQFQQQTTSGAY